LPKGFSLDIQDLIEAIRQNRMRITDHADEEAESDELSFDEIFLSVLQGEIIEKSIPTINLIPVV
jgi:hypothetical protein